MYGIYKRQQTIEATTDYCVFNSILTKHFKIYVVEVAKYYKPRFTKEQSWWKNTSEKSCPGCRVVLAKILLQFISSKGLDYISERISESLI